MKIHIFLFSWVILCSGCSLMDSALREKEFKIQELEKEKTQLNTENKELQQQNQKLASTGTRILDRLSNLQKRYQQVNEENKELSNQNQDLYQKLYAERLNKHKKFQKEMKSDVDDLQQEAEKLFHRYGNLNSEEPLVPETSGEGKEKPDSMAPEEPTKTRRLKPLPEEPTEFEESTKPSRPSPKKTVEDSSAILERLQQKRLQLLDEKLWTMRDERKYMDLTTKLQGDIPNQEKAKVLEETLAFEQTLDARANQ